MILSRPVWYLCLCVVVVVVVVVVAGLLVVVFAEDLPPHPVTAKVAARVATSVSMAVSGVLLMGRAPIVARWLGRPPYQAFSPPIAVGQGLMSVEATVGPGVAPAAPADGRSGSRLPWLLVVCCVAQFMVILDLSIVNVALPSIQSAPRLLRAGTAVDRRRLLDHVRRLPDARRPRRRSLRPAPHVRRRRCCCSRSPRWPAASRRTAARSSPRARCRVSAAR